MAIEKRQIKKKLYKIVKQVAESDKCPPQARLIVDTINKADGALIREDLINQLKRPPEEGGLKTNQTAERILGFYTPKLIAMGVLAVETVVEETEVEVPDKPVKAEKPAVGGAEGAQSAPAPESSVKSKKGKKAEVLAEETGAGAGATTAA